MNADSKPTYKEGQAYERWMGRWSRLTGRQFLDWLQIPPRQRWLDVGCGTGALTEAILSGCDPELVVAFDSSEQQLAYARSRIDDKRLAFRIGDAISIDAKRNSFDVAASALVLNFIPDQRKAMTEMIKVVRPGGVVAVYVWDFAGRRNITQHLSDAIAAVAPDAGRTARTAQQAETTKPEALAQLFRAVGLETIETTSLDIVAEFEDFDDYWISNTSLISPVSLIGTAGGSLSTTEIKALKQKLREYLPADGNGKISFAARAWAARGTVPGRA
jgi:ubiquinone/menaquinone biosynthesis C-methylase UbiE